MFHVKHMPPVSRRVRQACHAQTEETASPDLSARLLRVLDKNVATARLIPNSQKCAVVSHSNINSVADSKKKF